MYHISHPTHFAGRRFATVRDAVQAFVDAGCPDDRVQGRCAGAWIAAVAGDEPTISLFPKLPDVFASMTRTDARTAFAAGLRGWTYPAWWSAWLTAQSTT